MSVLSIICFKEIHFAEVTVGCTFCTATSFYVVTADECEAVGVEVRCQRSWRDGSRAVDVQM